MPARPERQHRRERQQRFERTMSDAEALMWNIEKDPWLNPNAGTVSILDRPIDIDQFRCRMANAVSKVRRLRDRVVPGLGRLSPPTWATDPDFDLGYHVRHIALPAPGTTRMLYDLATTLYEDPYDRTRPLWIFTVVDGVEGGRGALITKMHHSITDGIGQVRLSELYMEPGREAPLPPPADLHQVLADALAAESAEGREVDPSPLASARKTAGHLLRRQAGIAQRTVGEVASWSGDPLRVFDLAGYAAGEASSVVRQLGHLDDDVSGGSPLWAERSRARHLESLRVPLDAAKAAGKALGGTINDVFVTGAINGALAYHAKRDVEVDALNVSFVVSTRHDDAIGGNAFTPTLVQVPGEPMEPEARFWEARDRMAARRLAMEGHGGLSSVAWLANFLPTSVVTQVARSQAARVDFATSNLRAAPFPTYISGAEVLESAVMGPVAGTAFNLTTLSYNGSLDMGMFIDPAAVDDPADLLACMTDAYQELLAAGGIVVDTPVDGER
jgi:WS/DGAT/MGAT family acyltransferase